MRIADRLELESRVEGGRDRYAFETADGTVSPGEFRDAELLLLGSVVPDPDDAVLVLDANYGVVGTVLSDLAGRACLTETSARAAALCERNLAANGCGATVRLTADVTAKVSCGFDRAAYAPKPYQPVAVVRERLRRTLTRLREGGELTVAARPDEGANRYRETMADLAGGVERAGTHGEVRAYRCVRGGEVESGSFVEERTFEATVGGRSASFVTRPGLFSAGHLDTGTRHLIEELPVGDGDAVLDVACGYGPVGVFAALAADCTVHFSDDDAVATAYARRNAERNGVTPAGVVTADGATGVRGERFDLVAANPPTHAGDGVIDDLFAGVADVLAPEGAFAVVYNDVLGYEGRLGRWFGGVETVREADGFAVTVARP